MGIDEALRKVQAQMVHAATRSGRNPADIKLVAVTKTVALPEISEAIQAGVFILGENRVQEAQKKIMSDELKGMSEKIEWHLIGTLQKNKARTAVQLFDVIQSIDSVALAEEVDNQAGKIGKIQRVMVQVKLADESAKHGINENNLLDLLTKTADMKGLKMEGLMTIPPYFEDPEKTRPYFKRLKQLADKMIEKGFALHELSMGMSNDFKVAIEEGATLVRVGTAIFGERN